MENTKAKVGSIIVNVIAILICVVLVLIVASAIGSIGKDYVDFFGSTVFAVETDSMEWNEEFNPDYPQEYKKTSFDEGALLFAKVLDKEEAAKLSIGDVIVFRQGMDESGRYILNTHRIVEVVDMGANGIFYRTKGDNVLVSDPTQVSAADDVIAQYKGSHINHLGDFALWMQKPVGFGLVVFLPSVLLLVYCAIMLFKNLKTYKTEKAVDHKEEIRRQLMEELGIVPQQTAEDKPQAEEETPTEGEVNDTQASAEDDAEEKQEKSAETEKDLGEEAPSLTEE